MPPRWVCVSHVVPYYMRNTTLCSISFNKIHYLLFLLIGNTKEEYNLTHYDRHLLYSNNKVNEI